MDNKIKNLIWKLDREIWAHVPDGGQTEPWTTSKAREESAKLISTAFEEIKIEEMNRWKNVVDGQRLTLSEQFEIIQMARKVINEPSTHHEITNFNTRYNDFINRAQEKIKISRHEPTNEAQSDVGGRSEQLFCPNCKTFHTNTEFDSYCSLSCWDGVPAK